MARTFGGVSTDKVAFAASAAINDLVAQTWSGWTYRTGDGGGGAGRIIDKANGAAAGGALIYQTSTQHGFNFYRYPTAGMWSAPAPSANAWHHFAIAYDASSASNDPLIYIDGVSQTVTEIQAPSGTIAAETEPLNVGNRTANDRNWAGMLAELCAHNAILTPTQIGNLFLGFMAHTQQPSAVRWYAPLWALHSPEIDISTNLATGTVTGTVAATHPPGIKETALTGDVLTIVTEILTLVQNTATLEELKNGVVGPLVTVVADGGNSATSFKINSTVAATDFWADAWLSFETGALAYQVKRVSAFNVTTDFITVVGGFTGAPAAGDTARLVTR